MWRRIWQVVVAVALVVWGVKILSLGVPSGPNLDLISWSIIPRACLLVVGVGGMAIGVWTAVTWFLIWQTRNDVMRDRSWDPAALPERLRPLQADLESLGFRPLGQGEVVTSGDGPTRIYQFFARPSDRRVVASLSYKRCSLSFTSHFVDGRILETVHPPVGIDSGVLPARYEIQDCAEGVAVALARHESRLEGLSAIGAPPVAMPDFQAVLIAENDSSARIRAFQAELVLRPLKGNFWGVVLCPVALLCAVFYPWG